MESKKINQLATELTPALSDLTIIGDPTTGISKKITLSQMASLFTGTVEEYASVSAFPLVGVADTIYIALDTNVLYRWDTGTNAYVELSPNIINSLVFNDANGFDGTISLVGSVATLTITTALTTGSIGFIGASGALTQDNDNFYWDNSNKRLGIGTKLPTTAIDVFGSGIIGRLNGTSTNNAFLGFASAGTNKWSIGNVQSDHRFRIYSEANTAELVSVLQTGEFGIGIANPTTKLHIDGGASALIANLDANVSVAKSISFRSDNSARINLEVSGTESGSNAGGNFFIRRYSDAGSLIDTPLTITRSTGASTFSNSVTATAFIPTGSTIPTNGMYLPATNTVSFATNSIRRGGFKENGDFEVGFVNSSNDAMIFNWSGASSYGSIQTYSSSNLLLNPYGNNVGIGHFSPAYKLDVRGAYDAAGIITVRSTDSAAIDKGGVLGFGGFHNGSSNQSQWAYIKGAKENSNVNDNASYLSFATQTSGGSMTERFRLSSTGVGTFTNNLVARNGITIYGAAGGYTTGDNPFLGLGTTASDTFGAINAPFGDKMRFNAYHGFQWYTSNSGSSGTPVSKMILTTGGNLGIHTTNVLSKLQIGSPVVYTGSNYTFALSNSSTDFLITLDAAQSGSSTTFYSSTDYYFNKSGPASTGIITAFGFNNISDYRMKENLSSYNPFDIINNIKTYKYDMIDTKETQYGVLAHEVQEILPHIVVGVKDGDRLQSVDYSKIVPILIKGIQELKSELNELKAK